MARVKSPLFSLDASGTIGEAIVYSQWKNRPYVREHVIPFNPKTSTQTNLRAAFTLLVNKWQVLAAGDKTNWNNFAEQFDMSGFNQFMSRGIKAYVDQLGTTAHPTVVNVTGIPPSETWTWA